jgi:hypothetical protein
MAENTATDTINDDDLKDEALDEGRGGTVRGPRQSASASGVCVG